MRTAQHASRAQKHLDVYEPWKDDHQDAMRCRDLEEWLHEGVSVFGMIALEDIATRSACRAAYITRDEAIALTRLTHERYRQWLKTAASGYDAIAWCRGRFGEVRHAADLEERVREAKAALARPLPVVAKAAGARHDELSEEEAAELRAMFASPPAMPAREYKALPIGDPSRLR